MTPYPHFGIQPGQWFQQNRIVWEVDNCITVHGIPHAKLLKVGDRTESKLIAVRALYERYDFAPTNAPKAHVPNNLLMNGVSLRQRD